MTELALSSYWRRGQWKNLSDFFRTGIDLGFSAFEVSGLASLVPPNVLRVVEVDQTVTANALRAGIKYLSTTSWLGSV